MNFRIFLILPLLFLNSGCSSFGEGLMRGLVQQENEDTRQCYVRGPAFDGIDQMIEMSAQPGAAQDGDIKVLMVHGIGTHLPGYSTRIAENLARELGLDVVERTPKVVTLRLHADPAQFKENVARGRTRGELGEENGNLTLQRYSNKDGSRSMVFYELTWSEITAADKRIMNFDDSGAYSFRRAGLNNDLKKFINSHLPDPLIYLGDAQGNIQNAVSQALCWMFTQDYEELPERVDRICDFHDYPPDQLFKDSFVFVSHSLGSRILTDALQGVTAAVARERDDASGRYSEVAAQWVDAMRREPLTIFMLSNQLPLLQLGRPVPEVTNQITEYCTAEGVNSGGRVFAESKIIAVSDPNDILSWSVPPGYEDQYIDSRMCPVMVNVIINIAKVKNFLGVELAAPGEAHRGYDNDDRVVKMIARGVGKPRSDPLIQERCEWIEVH
jgi:hypothetical protein